MREKNLTQRTRRTQRKDRENTELRAQFYRKEHKDNR
jgi:hypothetical protein